MVPKGGMFGKNLDNASSGFLFCVLWQVPGALFDWVDKNIDFGHVFLRCGFFWHQEILR